MFKWFKMMESENPLNHMPMDQADIDGYKEHGTGVKGGVKRGIPDSAPAAGPSGKRGIPVTGGQPSKGGGKSGKAQGRKGKADGTTNVGNDGTEKWLKKLRVCAQCETAWRVAHPDKNPNKAGTCS